MKTWQIYLGFVHDRHFSWAKAGRAWPLALALGLLAGPFVGALDPRGSTLGAKRAHGREPERTVAVIDLHVDLPYQVGYKGRTFATGSGEFRAADLLPAGLAGVVLPLFVPRQALPSGRTAGEFEASYARVFSGILATRPYALPGCGVQRAGGEARAVETWLAFEGSEPLAAEEHALRSWAVRGVRIFGLVHAQHNDLAESSGEASTGRGLSGRGERFVHAVYAVGGLVDVSHASDEATSEVLDIARKLGRPVVATHSNARALAAHPRNLTDEHIRAIGASGGVVGVNFHQRFLDPGSGRATLREVVAMVAYLARLGGDGVVAIGSDFEGGIRPVDELTGAGRYQVLARALIQAGFSEAQVAGFLAKNARRLLCSAAKVMPPP